MWTAIRSLVKSGAATILAAGLFVGASIVPYVASPSIRVSFSPHRPLIDRIAAGFYPAETTPQGIPFAWTDGDARVLFPHLDRRPAWRLRIRLARGAWPRQARPPALALEVDGRVETRMLPPTDFADQELFVARRPGRRGLMLRFRSETFVPGPHDPRRLGVVVSEIVLEPEGLAMPPVSALVARVVSGVALAVALKLSGLALPYLTALLGSLGLFSGWLLRLGSAAYAGYDSRACHAVLWIAGTAAVLLLAAKLFGRPRSQATGLAFAVSVAAMSAKALVVFHPDMIVGDTIFHLHRFQRVLAGRYLFTSVAPGGEFPYPVGLYVVASWLRPLMTEPVTLLRALVFVADAAAGFAVYGLAGRLGAKAAAGLWAATIYHLTPAAFQVHGAAYLTNAFAHAISVVGLFGLSTLTGGWLDTWRLAGTTAALALALLSHTSTAAILSVTAGMTCLLFVLKGDPAARRAASAAAFAFGLALGVAIALYYRHFADTYSGYPSMVARAVRTSSGSNAGVPEQKAEAHQTAWAPGWIPLRNRLRAVPGYVAKYLEWPLLMLAGLGGWISMKPHRRDRVALLLWSWICTCVLFLLIGLLTPVDLRYYLAVAPALAVLAGVGVAEGLRRHRLTALVVLSLFAWFAGRGLWYWMAWLSPAPPR